MPEKFSRTEEPERRKAKLPVGKPMTEKDAHPNYDLNSTAKDKKVAIKEIPNRLSSHGIKEGDSFAEERWVFMFDLELEELSQILEEKYGYRLENKRGDIFTIKRVKGEN